MIVRMKKVTLLALNSEQNAALTALRALGVMQIETAKHAQSENAQRLAESYEATRRVVGSLDKLMKTFEEEGFKFQGGSRPRSGAEAVEQAGSLLDARERLIAERDSVAQRLRRLAVWGDFDGASIDALRSRGVYVYLCAGAEEALNAAEALDGVECRVIGMEGRRLYFAVIATAELAEGTVPEVHLTKEDNPQELHKRAAELEKDLKAVDEELRELFGSLPAAKHRVKVLGAELEYARAEDSLSEHDRVVSLTGFVPVPSVPKLEEAAKKNGWGLLIVDPGPEDRVPTLIKTPKWVSTIEPLFKFLGISPGYDEIDVSAGVLIFFTIFYAMIVGDAGYGLVFLIGTLVAGWKFRNVAAAKAPVRLMTLLSVATIIWGLMSSNIFGLANPGFLKWAEVPQLTDTVTKDANTQFVCFSLALLQLSLGRIWRAIHTWTVRGALASLGWMLFIWANFILTIRLLVYPGPFPTVMFVFYIVGLLLVMACDVNWKSVADIFQFPFNVIGSFVDVLSYIRLFAVGLAGYYIASSFNGMGANICKASSEWYLLPVCIVIGVAVILLGHVLNLGLCMMSVMVHGVRLNTLEFSNHVGLSWAGSKFKPFRNIKKLEDN